jgi:hypothetical protein
MSSVRWVKLADAIFPEDYDRIRDLEIRECMEITRTSGYILRVRWPLT